MKKLAVLILTMLLLCAFCLPVGAANTETDMILNNAEEFARKCVQTFGNDCLSDIPVNINPVIFANLNVQINGAEACFNSVASLDETKVAAQDTIIVIPNEEEYVEPIVLALMENHPYYVIEEEHSSGTDRTRIVVSLPEMTKDMRDICERMLDAFWRECNEKINFLRLNTSPKLFSVGGKDAEKTMLDKICDDEISRMNEIKAEYEGYIQAQRNRYLKNNPDDADEYDEKTGSMFSVGSLMAIVGLAGLSIGFLTAMCIFRKKKPVLSENNENED